MCRTSVLLLVSRTDCSLQPLSQVPIDRGPSMSPSSSRAGLRWPAEKRKSVPLSRLRSELNLRQGDFQIQVENWSSVGDESSLAPPLRIERKGLGTLPV